MGGDDERGARPERGDQSGRNEEVRVDDVRCRASEGPSREREVAKLPTCARVEHRAVELVPARDERVLELRDERAQIRCIRARVHLRHEQNPHARSVCRRSYFAGAARKTLE